MLSGDATLSKIWSSFERVPFRSILEELVHYEELERRWTEQAKRDGVTLRSFVEHFYVPDRWKTFERAFFDSAVTEDGKLVVFRCLEHPMPHRLLGDIVSDRSRTGYQGRLGLYWTWSSASARCYWGTSTLGELHLTGLVSPGAINVKETVRANFHPETGEDEREIQLNEGANVTLVEGCFRQDQRADIGSMPCRPIERVVRKA